MLRPSRSPDCMMSGWAVSAGQIVHWIQVLFTGKEGWLGPSVTTAALTSLRMTGQVPFTRDVGELTSHGD